MPTSNYSIHPNYPEIRIPAEETWVDIVGYEGIYQVSTFGRVKSLARVITSKKRKPNTQGYWKTSRIRERLLSQIEGGGYLYTTLCRDGGQKISTVHYLVLTAFVGARLDGLEGCHNDGDYHNNRLENLRWDTHKGNSQDRIRHGTSNRGEKNGSAKITEEQVWQIRKSYATGKFLMRELGKQYGVSEGRIGSIVKGTTWKHVKMIPYQYFGRGPSRLLQCRQD